MGRATAAPADALGSTPVVYPAALGAADGPGEPHAALCGQAGWFKV